jgi:hypothetical protein
LPTNPVAPRTSTGMVPLRRLQASDPTWVVVWIPQLEQNQKECDRMKADRRTQPQL